MDIWLLVSLTMIVVSLARLFSPDSDWINAGGYLALFSFGALSLLGWCGAAIVLAVAT